MGLNQDNIQKILRGNNLNVVLDLLFKCNIVNIKFINSSFKLSTQDKLLIDINYFNLHSKKVCYILETIFNKLIQKGINVDLEMFIDGSFVYNEIIIKFVFKSIDKININIRLKSLIGEYSTELVLNSYDKKIIWFDCIPSFLNDQYTCIQSIYNTLIGYSNEYPFDYSIEYYKN